MLMCAFFFLIKIKFAFPLEMGSVSFGIHLLIWVYDTNINKDVTGNI